MHNSSSGAWGVMVSLHQQKGVVGSVAQHLGAADLREFAFDLGLCRLLDQQGTEAMTPGAAMTVKISLKPKWRRVSSATTNEPAMPPKRPMPIIQATPVARPRVG